MSEEEKKYFDAEGNEIENVLSVEDAEAQKVEALEEYKTENPNDEDLKTSLEEKETLLKEREEELEKEKEKKVNFAELRKKKGSEIIEKEEEVEQLRSETRETKEQIEILRNEITGGKRTEAINKMSDDEEERKKIKFHLDRLSKSDDTEETFQGNLNDAYLLATKQEAPAGGYISSAGAGNVKVKKEDLSENAKALAKRFKMSFTKTNK